MSTQTVHVLSHFIRHYSGMQLFDAQNYVALPKRRRVILAARKTSTFITGMSGEEIVAERLREREWTILGHRVRTRWGELDLVARRGDTVIFCEVKATSGDGKGLAIQVDRLQQHRLRRAAVAWMAAAPALHRGAKHYRFDVFLVRIAPNNASPRIEHIANAF
jgi:putative endonuclease